MKKFILFILIFGLQGSGAFGGTQSKTVENLRLSVGTFHSCFIADDGAKCWGKNDYGQTNVPTLINPRQISAGDDHTCALDDDGVKCWGKNDQGQTDIPTLREPRRIVAGAGYTCATHADGLTCWGSKKEKQDSSDFEQIKSGSKFSCIQDINGHMTCARLPIAFSYEGDDKIFQVGVGENYFCAIWNEPIQESTGRHYYVKDLQCRKMDNFGQIIEFELTVPRVNNRSVIIFSDPIQLSVAGKNSCVIFGQGGLKCWTYEDQPGYATPDYKENLTVPEFKNPILVSAGINHFCALDERGVHCWGDNKFGQTDVPDRLLIWNFDTLKKYSPISHVKYYEALVSLESSLTRNSESEYLFRSLLRPSVEKTDSDYFNKVITPLFQARLIKMKAEGNFPEINLLSDSNLNRQIALKHIQAGLVAAFEFLAPVEKNKLEPVIQKIGAAYSETSDANVKAVLEMLGEGHSVLESLKGSERTAFITDVIDLSSGWLHHKVP
jgi:hypothetical protein